MPLAKPYITFCVPAYNSESFLHVALDSLMRFDDRIEVLIIDDGSTDNTLSIAKSYEASYPIFRAVHQENKGHGGAINTAIGLAKGRYFKVLDSDDWVDVNALNALLSDIERCEAFPDVYVMDYTYWRGYECEGKTISYENAFPARRTIDIGAVKRLKLKQNFTVHSTMIALNLLKSSRVHVPEHCSYDDNYLVYVALSEGGSIRYLHYSLYQYLTGREGQSMSKENLYRKWGDIIATSEAVFLYKDIMPLKKADRGRYRLLRHHLNLIVAMVPFCCQMNGSPQAREGMNEFFKRCKEQYPEQYRMVKSHPVISLMRAPGKLGKWITHIIDGIARKIVRFN